MTDRIPPRLFVLLARQAPVGIIIRRGPSKWCQLIKWNTGSDQIQRGQWLHNRVYERRSDLSIDGTRLLYFALDGHWKSETKGSFTAISKPPYWNPIAVWPKGDTLFGGGMFLDGKTLFLNQAGEPLTGRGAKTFEVVRTTPFNQPDVDGAALNLYFARMRRDGWQQTVSGKQGDDPRIDSWFLTHPDGSYRLVRECVATSKPPFGSPNESDRHAIETAGTRVDLPDVEWADFDHRGRLVFARQGALWTADVVDATLKEKLIMDFNNDKPGPVETPGWARVW